MKPLKNERGYVLIIVLLTSVMITIMAMVLLPKALNTAHQVNKTEKSTRAKDMSEMGVQYSYAYLQSQVNQAIDEVKKDANFDKTNHDYLFCQKIKTRLTTNTFSKTIKMNDNPKFYFQTGYSSEPITITSKDNTNCDGFKGIKVPILSTGKSDVSPGKSLKSYFVIENKGLEIKQTETGASPDDPITLTLTKITDQITLSGNTESKMVTSPRYTSPVTIKGNAVLSIGGNAWFQGGGSQGSLSSVDFRGQNGKLIISGNAYFSNPVSFGGNGSVGTNYVCVRGDAYLRKNGTTNTWEKYTDVKQYCPDSIKKDIEYFYDINDWFINPEKLDVQYK
jgi:type II secretory pathway pseudopilin PulG